MWPSTYDVHIGNVEHSTLEKATHGPRRQISLQISLENTHLSIDDIQVGITVIYYDYR